MINSGTYLNVLEFLNFFGIVMFFVTTFQNSNWGGAPNL